MICIYRESLNIVVTANAEEFCVYFIERCSLTARHRVTVGEAWNGPPSDSTMPTIPTDSEVLGCHILYLNHHDRQPS